MAESLISHKKRRFLFTSFAHQSHGFELKTVLLLRVRILTFQKESYFGGGCVLYVELIMLTHNNITADLDSFMNNMAHM